MGLNTFNPMSQETEASEPLCLRPAGATKWVLDQPVTKWECLKKKKNNNNNTTTHNHDVYQVKFEKRKRKKATPMVNTLQGWLNVYDCGKLATGRPRTKTSSLCVT